MGLQFPLGARQLAGNAGVMLAGKIHRFRKRLEQSFYDMMRLIAIKQLQVQIATGFIGKSLEKLTRQAKSKLAGGILAFFRPAEFLIGKIVQSPPNQVRSPAEIHHAARQAFVHRDVSFGGKRILRVKTVAIAANPFFVSQGLYERQSERQAAIFHCVMGVHFQITLATQRQVHNRMFGEQGEHVIEKRDTRFDGRFPPPIEVQLEADAGFFGDAPNNGLPWSHGRN
jgi:hypothetical protein